MEEVRVENYWLKNGALIVLEHGLILPTIIHG
jgi:hypothetical protein